MNDIIILLVGPSGSGKSTIANALSDKYSLTELRSYTTRPERYVGERGHLFVTDTEFDALTNIMAYTEFDGYRYCSTEDQINSSDIYVVDVVGCESLASRYHGPKKLAAFWISCPPIMRAERISKRDGGLAAVRRIENDRHLFAGGQERLDQLFKYVYIIDSTGEPVTAADEIMCCVDFVRGD